MLAKVTRDTMITLTATDGIRLATQTLKSGHLGSVSSGKILVPAKNVIELSKLLANEEEIQMDIMEASVRFSSNKFIVESTLVEGTFPPISKVIPQLYSSEIVVNTRQIERTVESVSVLAGERTIRLVTSNNTLQIHSYASEVGDIQSEIPLLRKWGDDFSISLNGSYLFDILRNLDIRHVKIRFTGKLSPIVIIPECAEQSSVFLITPVRTRD